jgi:predicted metal-dependent phosphoesterase TrpH
MKLRRLIEGFIAAGGCGIEIVSGRQSRDQIAHLGRLARDYDLEVSLGSDFHRDAPYSAELGVDSSAFNGLRGVWERWSPARQVS